jgi:hypothetical protein
MTTFWLSFIITEAVGVASAFVSISNIKPGLKAALENLITAGQGVITAIQDGQ